MIVVTCTQQQVRTVDMSDSIVQLKKIRENLAANTEEPEKSKSRVFGKVLVCPVTDKKFPEALMLFENI